MTGASPYELSAPTEWAGPPEKFSFSSLDAVTSCPRRWQLLRSRWGDLARFPERAHPSAIEGQIVHEALERLSRALCRLGRPAIESPEFRQAIADCGFWSFFDAEVATWNARSAGHPRTGPGFVIRTAPGELANRAVQLLRERYRPAAAKPRRASSGSAAAGTAEQRLTREGVLTELRLDHPTLPLMGVLDLVERDDDGTVVVVDFKTGAVRETHRAQLLLYAVLWWRRASRAPGRIAVQYLDGGWEEPVSERDLEAAEEQIGQEIAAAHRVLADRPAAARPSKDCARCAVRARCDDGWKQAEPAKLPHGRNVDVEVLVASPPSRTGFTGLRRDGSEVHVVYEAAVGVGLPTPFVAGAGFRLVDAQVPAGGDAVEVRPWTEVFRV